jgi:NAD(P)-dependent dehydrogenase (short-subunit alcohol dehydrogenase family)
MIQGLVAGAAGGLAATWAMSKAQRLWTRAVDDHVPESAGDEHDARDWQERSEGKNSNELAAQALAMRFLGRYLTRDELRIAAPLMHYAFGAFVGALYGAYADRLRGQRAATGFAFGTTLWLAADEVAMPLLGLSEPTTRRPFEMHLQSFAAHLVYGLTAEVVRKLARERLGNGNGAARSYDFDGKVVLITGGSRGLGLVLARQLVHEGARVTLIARDPQELQRATHNIHRDHPNADVLVAVADVRQRDDVDRAVKQSVERYGRIDVVINNAGIIQVGPLEHMRLSDYEDAMNTHFWGPLYMVLAALPHMRRQGEGRVVNISSIGGRIAVPHMLPYSASKFALTGLSDGLRAELAAENISVTTVCPGLMRTGSPINAMFKGKRAQEYTWFAVSSSLPMATIDAERAARQILAACRRGEAELVITPQAKLAIVARAVAPELFGMVMSLMNRLLPASTGPDGDAARPGRTTGSAWATSPIMASTYAAAQRNNEL